MLRNKLPFILIVVLMALLLMLGLVGASRGWKCHNILYTGGQFGLGAALVLYFVIPDRRKEHER